MSDKQDQTPAKQLVSLDPVIHAPARLSILSTLAVIKEADFVFLLKQTGLTRGNLSVHISKLESAGYISVEKKFVQRIPRTVLAITDTGRKAFTEYRDNLSSALGTIPDEK